MFFDDDTIEPNEDDLKETVVHAHVCGNCGIDYPCAEVRFECEEPFICAECALTEGEDGND